MLDNVVGSSGVVEVCVNCWDGGQVVAGEGVWSRGWGPEGEGGVVQGVGSLDGAWGGVGVLFCMGCRFCKKCMFLSKKNHFLYMCCLFVKKHVFVTKGTFSVLCVCQLCQK